MKKRGKTTNKNYQIYISLVIVAAVIMLTTGFAAFQNELLVNNISSTVTSYLDVRVMGVTPTSVTNNATVRYETYNQTIMDLGFNLPDEDSTVTYSFVVTNLSNTFATISDILGLPENLTYTLSNYDFNTLICDDNDSTKCVLGATTVMSITISYAEDAYDAENTSFDIELELEVCYQENAVAMIGTNLYTSLQKAVNAVPANTQTNIILLKDTSECFSVPKNKNIVFQFNNHTITNSENLPIIWNYGTIAISDGTLTSNASTNGTLNNEDGNIEISGGTFINTGGRQAFYNKGGTALITGNPYFYNTTDQRAAVHNLSSNNNTGSLTIEGGTIVSAASWGVRNEATMVVGTEGGTPDQTAPMIQGYIDGIISTTNYSFYDGIVKGRSLALDPASRASTVESGYLIISSEETIDGHLYKTAFLGNGYKVKFDGNSGTPSEPERNIESNHIIGTLPTATRNGYTFDGWFTKKNNGTQIDSNYVVTGAITFYAHWSQLPEVAEIGDVRYLTLENAIAAVPDNTPTTIRLLKSASADITIESSKYVTIDLNGSTLSNSGSRPIITTSGHLVVENGYFTTSAQQAAINVTGGTTEITDCSIIASGNKSRQAVYITGGTVTIDGASYLQSQASGTPSGSQMERSTVQVIAGTLYIYDQVEIYASVNHAVGNEGTVIIGEDDGTIDQTYPILRGKKYGIKSTGTVSFYDGILKGETAAYYPTNGLNNQASNQHVDGTDGAYHTYYLVPTP